MSILISYKTGHSLLWSKAGNNPAWLLGLTGSDFSSAVFEHIEDTLDHFQPLGVKHWDVINEMVDQGSVSHTFYTDQSGDPDIRVKVHQRVAALYPDVKMYVNDYGIILDKNNRFALFQQLLRELISAGAPVHAIGLQSHIKGLLSSFVLLIIIIILMR